MFAGRPAAFTRRLMGKPRVQQFAFREVYQIWKRPEQQLSFNADETLPEINQRLVQQRRSFGLADHSLRSRAEY